MPLDWGGGQSANFTWGHVIPYMQGTCSREILGFHMDESYIVYMSFYLYICNSVISQQISMRWTLLGSLWSYLFNCVIVYVQSYK